MYAAAVFGTSSNMRNTSFIRTARWKYIEPLRMPGADVARMHLKPEERIAEELTARIVTEAQLFDLDVDSGETHNLALAYPDIVSDLQQRIAERRRRSRALHDQLLTADPPSSVQLTEDEKTNLRALGYAE